MIITGDLSKDDVSIANGPWSVVQVQNAVSTKESRPVRRCSKLCISCYSIVVHMVRGAPKNGQSWDFEGSPYSLSVLKRPGLSRSSCMLFLAIQDDTFMPWSLYFIDVFIFGGLACRGR